MVNGLSGSLLSHYFAECVLPVEFAGRLGEESALGAHRVFRSWWFERVTQLGPASSLRSIWNVASAPLAELLGFEVGAPNDDEYTRLALLTYHDTRVGLLAGDWSASLDSLWHNTVRSGMALAAPWCLCTNGHQIRLVDARRTYSRAFLQFDLRQTVADFRTFQVLWGLLRADAFRPGDRELVLEIIQAAARHRYAVSRSLRFGVIEAVQHLLVGFSKCGKRELNALFDESLTVVYRVLFLMFAEARGLVPNWHPLYKNYYTIESLRERVERPGRDRGLWETLQAIARLAHRGCHAGTLVVPAFNGRLFSPSRAPVADSCAVDDETARKALLGLSTTTVGTKRERIHYRDLGVEQLGAVYESVLEYEPVSDGSHSGPLLRRGSERRKSTGSFYTPQPLTDYVVRRTLSPLVAEASPETILHLRVVDPAMGSGAFLVSACRFLARAYERALIRENGCSELDVDETDRAGFRRQIAQRCLFGVDLNPTAVQLARLSLWLATLSAGKPLTFLDHRLVCGDSLLGASPVDVARQPPGAGRRLALRTPTSLFADSDLEVTLARAVGERRWLAEKTDDTIDVVKEKERRLDRLRQSNAWKALADLWCACWMWPDSATAPDAGVFASLSDEVTKGRSALTKNVTAALLEGVETVTRNRRFFHWVLEFPEAYFDQQGHPLSTPGFDAVLGNPPWDMLSAGSGEQSFFRCSGVYRYQGRGRINRYQVFLERAMTLAKNGGRIGLVLPSGFALDHTAAPLRRQLLAHSNVDAIIGFENRKAIFPIHRSVRFVVCTTTMGEPTRQISCRFGIDDTAVLENMPDSGDRTSGPNPPIILTPALIASLSGDKLTIPELRNEADIRILERIAHQVPRLGDVRGWNVRFGRELNATDDRRHFHAGRDGLPVLEGKHIEPFRAYPGRALHRISNKTASKLLEAPKTFLRRRLAYRDVASSTNRLSLIAAVLPAGVVTTHSLFCLKTPLSSDNQMFLCGMLNSFVANYLVRQVMTTHLGSATVANLRVPKPDYDSFEFTQLVDLARALEKGSSVRRQARLQAMAAWCYGLALHEFGHILTTFPLVPESDRSEALIEFKALTETSASA